MSCGSFGMEEFLILPGTSQESQDTTENEIQIIRESEGTEYTHWPRNVTLQLIDEYKKNYKKVGVSIRSFKKLFEMIAVVLNKTFNLNLSGSQVNNKFKTLERGYKKVIDNNNKTGRGRKYFEYEKEMDSIYEKSKKINPEILLSEKEIVKIPSLQGIPESSITTISEEVPQKKNDVNITNQKRAHSGFIKKTNKKTRTDVLQLIRHDRLEYQKQQMVKSTEKLEIEKEKLKERKRRNNLLEQRNQLLKKYLGENLE